MTLAVKNVLEKRRQKRRKKRRQGRKKGVDVFDADYDNDSHFGRAGKKGQAYGINTTVGYGKRNPNDVRTRAKKR